MQTKRPSFAASSLPTDMHKYEHHLNESDSFARHLQMQFMVNFSVVSCYLRKAAVHTQGLSSEILSDSSVTISFTDPVSGWSLASGFRV